MNKLSIVCLLSIILLSNVDTNAQKSLADTNFVGPPIDTTLLRIDYSNIEEVILKLPITNNEIPCNNVYEKWNNDHVRVKRRDMADVFKNQIDINLLPPGNFVFPVKGKVISLYGYRGKSVHTGIDIKLNKGDSVRACFDGVVRLSKRYSSYGKIVVIRHYNGIETVYSHFSKLLVNVNQKVKAGDVIGLGGRTGRASTEHLHFETRYLEEPFNCQHFIDCKNFSLFDNSVTLTAKTFKFRAKPIFKKGFPAEFYEDDSSASDSLDTLYAHNWIWPAAKLKIDSTKIDSTQLQTDTISTIDKTEAMEDVLIKKTEDSAEETIIKNLQIEKPEKPLKKENLKQKNHIVKAKETYYSISKKHNTTVEKLLEINKLSKEHILSIGEELIIPTQ